MSIPFGYSLGNRSEYLAIPALTKLGFTVPVPRQEDHFGVDFIVHLASLEGRTVHPTGKSFGIQIKANDDPLVFDSQQKRDCLYNSSLPFFLGVVSRKNLTLKVYNTLIRLHCFWHRPSYDLTLSFGGKGNGIPKPENENSRWLAYTGKPIMEIKISEPEEPQEISNEIKKLQSVIKSWVELENLNLSLKEQGIALFYWPAHYEENIQLSQDYERSSYTKYAGWSSFSDICLATKRTLTAFSYYLRNLTPDVQESEKKALMNSSLEHVQALEKNCDKLLNNP